MTISYGRFRGPLNDADRRQRAVETARLGLARLQEGNLPQAEYDLYKALLLDPENATVRGYLGLVFFRLGRLEDATKELQVALSQAPDDEVLRSIQDMILAGLSPQDQPSEAAMTAATPASGVAPAPHDHANTNQQAESIALLEAKVAANPAISHLHRELSILYLRVGRLAEAMEQTRLAEALRPRRASS